MNVHKIRQWAVPAVCLALMVLGWRFYGGKGLALALGAVVMWFLLHTTRLMTVLRRASERPVGTVDSAVMLNSRLKRGLSLLHVIAMTRALGAQQSPPQADPEIWRWADASLAAVDCTFVGGRLAEWRLHRPDGAGSATVTQA